MLSVGMLTEYGVDEALIREANEKGLVIAELDAFQQLFPGESQGAIRTWLARGNTITVQCLGTNINPVLIWQSEASR